MAAAGRPVPASRHEDSLYYLAQWGRLRAASATMLQDLDAAMAALEKAVSINPEETGALLITAEVFLLQGKESEADQRLEWICRTNRRAVEAFFLRGFLAWKQGERSQANELLAAALIGREPNWKPAGTSAEGDVRADTATGRTLLSGFEENWNGSLDDLDGVFEELDGYLSRFGAMFPEA